MVLEMKICYLVLTFNNSEDTLETLVALTKQVGVQFDVCVVDNCSDAEFVEPIVTYSDRHSMRYIRRDTNDGYAGGNSFGWELLRAEYDLIFVINNDIIFRDEMLTAKLVCIFENDPRLSVLGPRILYADNRPIPDNRILVILENLVKRMHRVSGGAADTVVAVAGCFLAIRVSAIGQRDLFDRSFFMYAEELDLCLRVWNSGGVVARIIDETAAIYHKGGSTPFEGTSRWKFYLSMRNSILCSRNYAEPGSWIYIAFHYLLVLRMLVRRGHSFRLKRALARGLLSGTLLCLRKASSRTITRDASAYLLKCKGGLDTD